MDIHNAVNNLSIFLDMMTSLGVMTEEEEVIMAEVERTIVKFVKEHTECVPFVF